MSAKHYLNKPVIFSLQKVFTDHSSSIFNWDSCEDGLAYLDSWKDQVSSKDHLSNY